MCLVRAIERGGVEEEVVVEDEMGREEERLERKDSEE